MDACPREIYEAPVVAWVQIGPGVRPTGNTMHQANDRQLGPAEGLAICQATDGCGFFLFYCNSAWEEFADTWHETITGAKAQAEFEYEGVCFRWYDVGKADATPNPSSP